ncbi:MAG: hypothetical protein DHS20C14_04670 [Phycisphaeraceae bacterium]|nr:MAG: hypothetical protein DHS20C14_04670 [Phycisphaeraceae bacterium]
MAQQNGSTAGAPAADAHGSRLINALFIAAVIAGAGAIAFTLVNAAGM